MKFVALRSTRNLLIVACVLTTLSNSRCDAQSTVRPYKFGFTIDEQQHRYEKRDERGIVMGEFGFITADGIYHVTVYATDEEGKFRILAMKNYPYESPQKTIDMTVVQKPKAPMTPTPAVPAVPSTTPRTKFDFGQKACSGCFLTNKGGTSTAKDQQSPKTEIRTLSKPLNPTIDSISATPSNAGTRVGGSANTPTGNTPKTVSSGLPVLPSSANQGKVDSRAPSVSNPAQSHSPHSPPSPSGTGKSGGKSSAGSGGGNTGGIGGRVGGAGGDSGDLYRFKYLLDYNGHTETGSRNGNKQGNFYSIGDDNIERTIEYVANEFGFQPRVRWRKLDPNEIKSKENTLKDYEFVWFKQQ